MLYTIDKQELDVCKLVLSGYLIYQKAGAPANHIWFAGAFSFVLSV